MGTFCTHLCLLKPNNSYACACPTEMSLKPDRHSCQETVKRQYLFMGIGNHLLKVDVQSFGRHDVTKEDAFGFQIHRMAFNSITGELFVADNVQKIIYAVDLKSKESRKLVSDGIGNITALAFGNISKFGLIVQ